ncbi:hypothetical protein [Paenibacillus aestuarii]|uniref:Uncharacterized protein n=1 Tax=Paenibacillus aestuarii TaxID=516965 RepID=A0ABW0KA23_9BACL|nr:hypothetical protein [Paenibacillus aestuarii]
MTLDRVTGYDALAIGNTSAIPNYSSFWREAGPLHPLHGAVGRCANWYLSNCSEEVGGGGTCSPGKPNWRAIVCTTWPETPL